MALTGSLQEIEPADLIQLIDMGRKSGVLMVSDDKDRTVLYFRNGQLVHAVDANESEAREVVYAFVARTTGQFVFETRDPGCADTLSESTEGLVLEGMRRLDHEQRVKDRLPPADHRLVVTGGRQAGEELELTADQAHVLLAVDGERTAERVAQESGLPRLSAYEAVFQLIEGGILQAQPPASQAAPGDGDRQQRIEHAPAVPTPPPVTAQALRQIIEHVARM